MSKGARKTRDELARRLMEVLLSRMDAPVSLTVPDVKLEPMEIDEDWSLLKETHPEVFEDKLDPATIKRLKATVSGTTPTTIRVHNRVLRAFRQQADETGVPYQTLMNRVLAEAADAME
ncbi:BrnA antitoxin family protein [Hydrogenophaga aquatica]